MFCPNCGKENANGATICDSCYTPLNNQPRQQVPEKHDVPMCTGCGYKGNWKLGPILRPMDYVIGIVLLIFGVVPGIIYIGTVAAIRSNKDRREKICPKCKAKNLWTFIY
ncbi:MAG: zinc ribbon domain-containing protein [Clostridia bacterium]|nr:zinc ribbon domain-containing protein [Clostridia bacterium]